MLGFKKKKYDFIFSIGNSCESSQRLRKNGLQYMSMPFDWVTGSTFRQKINMICNGFQGFLDKENFEFYPEGKSETGCICYLNKKNNFFFPHDFPSNKPYEQGYSIVKAKYNRRIKRFYTFIEKSNKVLFVIKLYSNERMTSGELNWASEKFSEKDGKFGNTKQLDTLLKKYSLTFNGKYIIQKQYKHIVKSFLHIFYKKQLHIFLFKILPFTLFRIKLRFLFLKMELGIGRIKKGKF